MDTKGISKFFNQKTGSGANVNEMLAKKYKTCDYKIQEKKILC